MFLKFYILHARFFLQYLKKWNDECRIIYIKVNFFYNLSSHRLNREFFFFMEYIKCLRRNFVRDINAVDLGIRKWPMHMLPATGGCTVTWLEIRVLPGTCFCSIHIYVDNNFSISFNFNFNSNVKYNRLKL